MAEGIQSVAAARLTSPTPAQASCCGPANVAGTKKHRGSPSTLPASATGGAQPSTLPTPVTDRRPSTLPGKAADDGRPDFGDMIAWAREAMASAMSKGGAADRSGADRVQRTAGAERKADIDQKPGEQKPEVGRKTGRASDRGSTWIPDHVSGVLPSALAIAIQRARESDGDDSGASRTLPTTGAGRLRRPSTLPADRMSTLPADRPSTLPADRPWAPHVVLPSVLPTTLPVVDRRRPDDDR